MGLIGELLRDTMQSRQGSNQQQQSNGYGPGPANYGSSRDMDYGYYDNRQRSPLGSRRSERRADRQDRRDDRRDRRVGLISGARSMLTSSMSGQRGMSGGAYPSGPAYARDPNYARGPAYAEDFAAPSRDPDYSRGPAYAQDSAYPQDQGYGQRYPQQQSSGSQGYYNGEGSYARDGSYPDGRPQQVYDPEYQGRSVDEKRSMYPSFDPNPEDQPPAYERTPRRN